MTKAYLFIIYPGLLILAGFQLSLEGIARKDRSRNSLVVYIIETVLYRCTLDSFYCMVFSTCLAVWYLVLI